MPITPKENYLMLMRGEIPEYIPATYIQPVANVIVEDQIAPTACPNGPITTVYGVTYVGSEDLFNGALPKPGEILLDDITKWRDVIKNPDNSHRDWEGYYKKQTDGFDRENKIVRVHGGDYFLTLVSFMGFEGALIAMYQEPEEVYALFDYISKHYLEVMKMQIKYCKPEVYTIMDDDAAKAAPFFSLDMYRELVKPFHKMHADLALDNGILLDRHDCGHCELFIDDWWEMGIRSWNPAQISNDLVGIKKKYNSKLVLNGAWDNTGYLGSPKVDPDDLVEALETYVNTFAPGGGFVYSAAVMGKFTDPLFQQKSKIIADYYFAHVKDYYKTH
ncbi:MAG: veratrol--corrinoid protein metyltransferase [Oscillospiraceae bacterium]|nr:veratrol--corrinoid protein metyltransferase [Oscillospiraceae bacterium]